MPGTDNTSTRFTEWLADHPRMMGALFTMLVLLSQAGTVVANGTNVTNGP